MADVLLLSWVPIAMLEHDNQPLLSVNGLGRQVSGRWLWRNVSFDLSAGECLGLVAPSGVGKTLLMRNLVLLDPIDQGQVMFGGQLLQTWSVPTYRTQVIYLPQRATAFEGTVRENLQQAFALAAHRNRHYDIEQIHAYLKQLGRSPDFLDLQASQLSGGETQILALLRALQLEPRLLLLDEPTASVDAETTARMEALIQTWLAQPGRACLLTSHDLAQIRRVTHRRLQLGDFSDAA